MSEHKILTDELIAWIGRESEPETAQVTERDLKRFATAHTLWEPNPLHFDDAAASKTPFGGTIAPSLSYGNSFTESDTHQCLAVMVSQKRTSQLKTTCCHRSRFPEPWQEAPKLNISDLSAPATRLLGNQNWLSSKRKWVKAAHLYL